MRTPVVRTIRALGPCLTVLAALAVAGCYPNQVTSIQDLDIVVTAHNTEYDFSQNVTYAMPDSILDLCDVPEIDPAGCIEVDRSFDAAILAAVASQMNELGYTRIPTSQVSAGTEPDVVALVSVVALRNVFVSYPWWGGWGWWPGWGYCPGCYGPGWGWYYPPRYCQLSRVEASGGEAWRAAGMS